MVYGHNTHDMKKHLWADLQKLAMQTGHTAWCLLWDFNTILSNEDRIGGTEVTNYEVKYFAQCREYCELSELRTTGSYHIWTNKTV